MKKFIPRVTLLLIGWAVFGASVLHAQNVVRYGNSYVNLSKKTTGGTVEPGDTLEIRTNYYFPRNYNSGYIYYVRYVDNIPTKTTFAGDSIYLITNEGLLVKKYHKGPSNDQATYKEFPANSNEYNIRINIGQNAANANNTTTAALAGGGTVRPGTHRPIVAGGTLITTAFKVVVNGNAGDTITIGAGQLLFRTVNSTNSGIIDSSLKSIRYKILISRNTPICENAVGKNFAAEFGGTFGNGSTQTRPVNSGDLPVPGYVRRNLSPSSEINDGYYTIVNNLSPRASTFRDARKQNNCGSVSLPNPAACANRMFGGHWDIIGDHTGSTTPGGNDPVASGSTGGYMLVVNSDYATGEAYRQYITGLCPNTSYEFSLWVRNVCTNCGIDSTGTQTYKPGVLPNLTFAIDDLDRYSSGMVDTVGWIKKGFMFKTGADQEDIVISIRNNASGGGGNDWAIDDISLVTCNPNLTMLPSPTANVCAGQTVDISCLVRSFFDNYTEWIWERSINGGLTWTSTGVVGSSTATPAGDGQYEYNAAYPTFIGNTSDNGHMYRFRVASTQDNLSNEDCSFLNITTIQVNVENCVVLPTKLISFTGQVAGGYGVLKWITENETPNAVFEIERSQNGSQFTSIGTVQAKAPNSGSTYLFNDNKLITGNTWYRLKMIEGEKIKYSKIILLNTKNEFALRNMINPFTNQLYLDLVSPEKGQASVQLIDLYGREIKRSLININPGLNEIRITGLNTISNGMYILRIQMGEKQITKQVLKTNAAH